MSTTEQVLLGVVSTHLVAIVYLAIQFSRLAQRVSRMEGRLNGHSNESGLK
jgi:hypothetical protein